MTISKLAQLEMLLPYVREKAAECGDILSQAQGLDDVVFKLSLNNRHQFGFYIFKDDGDTLKQIFETLRDYYLQKSYGIEADIARIKSAVV